MHTRSSARPFPIVDWLRRRTRAQRLLAIIVVALYALYRAARLGATVVLDRWWYDSVTDAPIWSVMTTAKLQLAVVAGLITATTIGLSVRAVLRSAPVDDAPLSTPVRWYVRRMGPAHRWLLIIITVVLTERIASSAMDEWQTWLSSVTAHRSAWTSPSWAAIWGITCSGCRSWLWSAPGCAVF